MSKDVDLMWHKFKNEPQNYICDIILFKFVTTTTLSYWLCIEKKLSLNNKTLRTSRDKFER